MKIWEVPPQKKETFKLLSFAHEVKTEFSTTIFMYLYDKKEKLLFLFYKLFGPLPEKVKHFYMKVKKMV